MPAIIIGIIMLLGGSAVTVVAADSAKPGDLLYPIDKMAEEARLIIASDEKEVELRLAFSEERLKEVQDVLVEVNERKEKIEKDNDSNKSDNDANVRDSNDSVANSNNESMSELEQEEDNDMNEVSEAFASALKHLTENRDKLERHGNVQAVEALDSVIEKLTEQIQGMPANVQAKIEEERQDDDKDSEDHRSGDDSTDSNMGDDMNDDDEGDDHMGDNDNEDDDNDDDDDDNDDDE